MGYVICLRVAGRLRIEVHWRLDLLVFGVAGITQCEPLDWIFGIGSWRFLFS